RLHQRLQALGRRGLTVDDWCPVLLEQGEITAPLRPPLPEVLRLRERHIVGTELALHDFTRGEEEQRMPQVIVARLARFLQRCAQLAVKRNDERVARFVEDRLQRYGSLKALVR